MTAEHPVPIEDLLAHREWVRLLARSLVLDEHRADDVEQETWARALAGPPSHAASLRGWLASVVRHVLIDDRRAETRRAVRELAASRPEATRDDDVVARTDALRRVVQAAYELPEPYRTTLLLRYFEGLSIRELAKRTAAPPETVKTRLRRALELMRARLDEGSRGDRAAWCAAVLPLALGTGGAAVKTSAKVAIVTAVLLAAAGGAYWAARPSPVETPTAGLPAATQAPSAAAKRSPSRNADAGPLAGSASLAGEARLRADGRPAAGATMTLADRASGRTATATTDASGRFAFASLAPGFDFALRADAPAAACAPRRVGRLAEREARDAGIVWLDATGELEVTVVCASGSAEGTLVDVLRPPTTMAAESQWTVDEEMRAGVDPVAAGRADAAGVARFRRVPAAGMAVLARRPGFVAVVREHVDVPPGGVAKASILLERAAHLDGRLVDAAHRGVAGLRVFSHAGQPTIGAFLWPSWVEAESGADGRFTLDGLTPGPTTVYIGTDAGRTPVAVVRTPASGVVDIVVGRRAVEGVVTESESGRPVAGASVGALFGSSAGMSALKTTADADGRYRLEAWVDGTFNALSAEAPGFGPADSVVVRAAADETAHADLKVTRAAAVEGRVTADGRPVFGAEVHVNWRDAQSNLRRRDAETDADGRYAAADVPAGRLVVVQVVTREFAQAGWDRANWIQALMGRGEPSPEWSVRTEAGRTAHLDITMKTGFAVAGRVEDASGAPVSGANVYGGNDRAVSAADGAFRLVGVPGGSSALVTAWREGFTAGSVKLDLKRDADGVRIVMSAAPRIRGTVRSVGGGAPPDGAVVRTLSVESIGMYSDEASAWRWAAPSRVAADGSFDAWVHTDRGAVRIRAEAPGFAQTAPVEVSVTPGGEPSPVEIVLGPAVRLEGKVLDAANGRPVAGAVLALDVTGTYPAPGPGPMRMPPEPIPCATTDADGAFAVTDLAPLKMRGRVTAPGFVAKRFDVIVPGSGPLVLRLDAESFIASGVVRGPDGAPVSTASVSAVPDAGPRPDEQPWTNTDSAGRFELRGQAIEGTWTVEACPPPGDRFPNRWVKVPGVATGRTDVVIELGGGARINGRVLTSSGSPAGALDVRANGVGRKSASGSARTLDDGSFVLTGLDADETYEICAAAWSERRDDAWVSVCHDLPTSVAGVKAGAEDVVIRLDAGDVVTGTLLGEDGRPVAGAWLTVSPPRGQQETRERPGYFPCGGRTDEAGKFAVGGLGHGRVRIFRVELASIGAEPVFTPLAGGEDVASDAKDLTLRIPVLSTIEGRVVDEDGNALANATVEATFGTPGVVGSARSAADGSFKLDRLDASRPYVLRATKAGACLPAATDDVAPGAKDVVVRVKRGLRATGRVVGPDGKALRPAVLRFKPDGGGAAFSIVTDAESRFDVWGLVEGGYTVEAVVAQTQGGKIVRGTATIRAGDRDVEIRFSE
jgi:RNA polymerase sigma-70 factor (ECF subfamily)